MWERYPMEASAITVRIVCGVNTLTLSQVTAGKLAVP